MMGGTMQGNMTMVPVGNKMDGTNMGHVNMMGIPGGTVGVANPMCGNMPVGAPAVPTVTDNKNFMPLVVPFGWRRVVNAGQVVYIREVGGNDGITFWRQHLLSGMHVLSGGGRCRLTAVALGLPHLGSGRGRTGRITTHAACCTESMAACDGPLASDDQVECSGGDCALLAVLSCPLRVERTGRDSACRLLGRVVTHRDVLKTAPNVFTYFLPEHCHVP
ncbi:hypothetical protein E2C01_020002 [Portunus trituberculatus]|uniref:Uncharacterized protein n=1 Tax=Portunus trituberculatus TaxID=210409 RepID=A0A5B7DYW6_PORTR|nr:hypothetical protein [Portunus trituberculatus]